MQFWLGLYLMIVSGEKSKNKWLQSDQFLFLNCIKEFRAKQAPLWVTLAHEVV